MPSRLPSNRYGDPIRAAFKLVAPLASLATEKRITDDAARSQSAGLDPAQFPR